MRERARWMERSTSCSQVLGTSGQAGQRPSGHYLQMPRYRWSGHHRHVFDIQMTRNGDRGVPFECAQASGISRDVRSRHLFTASPLFAARCIQHAACSSTHTTHPEHHSGTRYSGTLPALLWSDAKPPPPSPSNLDAPQPDGPGRRKLFQGPFPRGYVQRRIARIKIEPPRFAPSSVMSLRLDLCSAAARPNKQKSTSTPFLLRAALVHAQTSNTPFSDLPVSTVCILILFVLDLLPPFPTTAARTFVYIRQSSTTLQGPRYLLGLYIVARKHHTRYQHAL